LIYHSNYQHIKNFASLLCHSPVTLLPRPTANAHLGHSHGYFSLLIFWQHLTKLVTPSLRHFLLLCFFDTMLSQLFFCLAHCRFSAFFVGSSYPTPQSSNITEPPGTNPSPIFLATLSQNLGDFIPFQDFTNK
jgi:hypothetical protein